MSSRGGHYSSVSCSGHALPHERCHDVLLPLPRCTSVHSLMASVLGLSGKEEAFLLEKSHLILKKFRKRLTTCRRAILALSWCSAEVVSDAGQVWAHCPDLPCLSFSSLKVAPRCYCCACLFTPCWGLAFHGIQDLSALWQSKPFQAAGSRDKGRT